MQQGENSRRVAQLAGARMPADLGLGSLGLIMQLGGSIFLGVMSLIALMPIFGPAPGLWVLFVIGASGAVRSAFHRQAGSALLYGGPSGPFRATYVYVAMALAQTALALLVLNKEYHLPGLVNLSLAATLLGWPLTLVAVLATPRVRRLVAEGLPPAEDMGFEGASVLMCLVGAIGGTLGLLFLFGMFQLPGAALSDPMVLVMIGVIGMLTVRSILQIVGGVRGTRGIDSDNATEAAARYYSFGVVSSVIAGGAILIMMVMSAQDVRVVPAAAVVTYILLVWPLALRRFYTERNFSALLAGSEGPNYRRAPDAGLTALGWLMLAWAAISLPGALITALSGKSADSFQLLAGMGGGGAADQVAVAGTSAWLNVAICAAQLWAALELIRMTDRHKIAASVYSAVALATTLYVYWPMIRALGHMDGAFGRFFQERFKDYTGLAALLVVPVTTLLLVHRKLTPTAQARIRQPATPQQD